MTAVDQFEQAWSDIRALTFDFIEAVPDRGWSSSPHPRFAAFNKQLRHMVCVQGVYHQGLTESHVDFTRKHSHYSGSLERDSLREALRLKDRELAAILQRIRASGCENFLIDFMGKPMRFTRYADVIIQHEAIHHGLWSLYAALGGFETPISWKLNWGL